MDLENAVNFHRPQLVDANFQDNYFQMVESPDPINNAKWRDEEESKD